MTGTDRRPDQPPTILVVDDDRALCKMVSMVLSASGYRAIEAYGGGEALAILEQQPVAGILLDIMMPRPDGYEVCRRVKADPATAHIPVMLVSALTDQKHRQQGFEAGADEIISKPIDAPSLVAAVRRVMPARQPVENRSQSQEKGL